MPVSLATAQHTRVLAPIQQAGGTVAPQIVPRTHADTCFPVETLSEEDRAISDRWLLDVLDREGLYTVASSLKPASLAFIAGRISVESPTAQELLDFRQAVRVLSTWRCGDLAATVLAGTVVVNGKRVLHGVLFRRSLLRQVIAANPGVFGAAGIAEALPAEQVLATTELLPPPLRHRAWGHLLGYPAYAVDFFARADAQQRETNAGNGSAPGAAGPMVPRDFFSVPTYARETNNFVWAVPRGHHPTAEDLRIRSAAAPILARYRELRSQYIGEGKPGVTALLREWLCTSDGCELPQNAAR